MTTDRILLLQPPPFHFRKFCVCAIYPSGRGCMRRPRARRNRRRHGGGSRCRERSPPGDGDGGGDGPPARSRSRFSAGRRS